MRSWPGRGFILLDAYAPCLTDDVERLSWSRGFISITHGGGASMILQTNDTDHHEHVRRDFINLQTQLMVRKARMQGGGLVGLDLKENIDLMIEVMGNLNLHLTATKGYLKTGTTNALNGDQDSEIKREAAAFWKEMDMREHVNNIVAKTLRRCQNNEIPSNYASIRNEIDPYPKRNCLDVLLPGQEDEATIDPDGIKWDAEEPHGVQDAASDAGGPIEDFCPGGWVDGVGPDVAFTKIQGTDAEHHGDGATALATVDTVDEDMVQSAFEHSRTMRQLREVESICKSVGGLVGATLRNTVANVVHREKRIFMHT